jgi:hypothetical protein
VCLWWRWDACFCFLFPTKLSKPEPEEKIISFCSEMRICCPEIWAPSYNHGENKLREHEDISTSKMDRKEGPE